MKKLLYIVLLQLLFNTAAIAAIPSHAKESKREVNDAVNTKGYLAGVFAARNNDFETASVEFEKALAQTPDDILLLKNTYKFMLLSGKYDKAAIYAAKYLEYEPKAVGPRIILAVKAVSEGDFAKASDVLDGAEQNNVKAKIIDIDQFILPFVRVWVVAGQGNYDLALNMLEPNNSNPVVSGTFIDLQKALLLSMSGDIDAATETFAAITGEDVLMPYNLAKAAASFYETIGKWDQAGRVYKQYRLRHPALPHFENAAKMVQDKITDGPYVKTPSDGFGEVMKETARLLFSNQLYAEGVLYLRLAMQLRPADDELFILLANFHEEQGDLWKAVDIYNKIKQNSDFYFISQVSKAGDLYRLDKKKDAQKLLLKVTEEINAKYIPLVTLADLLRKDNKFKDAINIYNRVLENIDQKSMASWAIFFARGMCFERLKEWEKSENDMLAALELNPNQPEVLNYLGYSWIDRNKNLEKAKNMLLKAVIKRPNDPQILDSAGWALYKLKDYTNAVTFLEKAAELLPQDAVINDHLGDVYWMSDRHYEARYQWQRAIKYGPAESSTTEELNQKIAKGLGR